MTFPYIDWNKFGAVRKGLNVCTVKYTQFYNCPWWVRLELRLATFFYNQARKADANGRRKHMENKHRTKHAKESGWLIHPYIAKRWFSWTK